MPLLSTAARALKTRYFLRDLPVGGRILEVGSGDGRVAEWLRRRGRDVVALDLRPPADIVGDVRDWRALGLAPASFDAIVAFEVVEHVDCLRACWELLRPGGSLLVTTPVPARDHWLARLEALGLAQRRTSPHDHLVDLAAVAWDGPREVVVLGGLTQWARLTRAAAP